MTVPKSSGGLQDLASGSLPGLDANPLQPSWSRSLSELYAANQALVGSTAAPSSSIQPTAAAQALLGGGSRTDISSLSRQFKAAASQKSGKGSNGASFQRLEDKCRQHRDGILERILRQERQATHDKFEKRMEERLAKDWEQERQWWLQETVGKRTIVDPTNVGRATGSATLAALPPSYTTNSRSGILLQGPSPTVTSTLLPGYPFRVNPTLDSKLALEHSRILQADPQDWVALLQQGSQDSGYSTAWQLLGCMLPRLSSPLEGARGALIHFCRQYQTFVKTRVDSAKADRRLDASNSTIADYCKLERGSQASIWDVLYYCLRCGDAVAARDAIQRPTELFPEQGLVQAVLTNLAQAQGNASCVWETGSVLPAQHKANLVDVHERTCNLEPENQAKIAVLALLAGRQLASSETIEDYLFGRLWAALQHEKPGSAVEEIGASIRKYGPNHFGGPEENGGWGYALPLLATQQFHTALMFLAQSGGAIGLLQATHLALVLSTSKVPVQDLGQSSNSSSPSNDLTAALLVKYASCLEQDPALGIGKAFDYLRKLPTQEQSLQEIAALVCRSIYHLDQLCGTLNNDGVRQPGELDKYMKREDVITVLTKAADNFRRAGVHEDRTKAELAAKLFMLAGKYDSLLSMLNDLISPTDVDSDDKRYWWTQSEQFYTHYLAQPSVVLSTLESENNTRLVTTSRTLMELRHVFSSLRQEKHQEAFEIINRMQLVPLTQEEINERESTYKDLDTIVKHQFPSLLKAAVHALHGMHRRIKSEAPGVDESTSFHLKDLQNKVRFLYIFSGLTSMPTETKEEIQRLRNNMI